MYVQKQLKKFQRGLILISCSAKSTGDFKDLMTMREFVTIYLESLEERTNKSLLQAVLAESSLYSAKLLPT